MSKGWVYILSNPSMPGLVKIGRTTRTVEQRMEELYQTGVPQRFVCRHSEWLPDCHVAEYHLHRHFDEYRLEPGREFFRCGDDEVREVICELKAILRGQVEELIDEFMPDHVICSPDFIIDEHDVGVVASQIGIHSAYVASSFLEIDREAIIDACRRYEDKIKAKVARDALV